MSDATQSSSTTVETDVVVVGGGPVGLAMSILLSLQGVRHLLFERHPATTFHPKARNLNTRTMEIIRGWGIGAEMDAVALGDEWCSTIAYCKDLVQPEIGRMATGGFVGVGSDVSPATPHLSSQDVYEPIWRARAEALAPDALHFGTSVEALDSSAPDHVRVTVSDGETSRDVVARYAVGCDGWNSTIRQHLGVELEGATDLARFVNVYFRADLSHLVAHRPSVLFFTTDPRGVFQPLDGGDRWLCQITHLDGGDPLEIYGEDECLAWVRRAAGDDALPVEIVSIGTWTMNATVAPRYRVGRVLMAGDAVHQLPPTGGFGANTGIQDAHNLAWKLAYVLDGDAGDRLLDTYDAERRPVAVYNATQSLENSRMVGRITTAALRGDDAALEVGRSTRYGNFTGMELGFAYDAGAVIADGSSAPAPEDPVVDYVPTSRPGHRLPHAWLDDGRSSLDLVGRRFVLVVSGDQVVESRIADVDVQRVSEAVAAGLELVPGGALLVRPDGHVGWRTSSFDAAVVSSILDELLAR